MGALCGKKGPKLPYEVPLGNPSKQVYNIPPNLSQPKPQVYNPTLDKSHESQKAPPQNPILFNSPGLKDIPKKALEVMMSPEKSPLKQKQPLEIIKETIGGTPQTEQEKPKSGGGNSGPQMDLMLKEPERVLWCQTDELPVQGFLGEEDWCFEEEKEAGFEEEKVAAVSSQTDVKEILEEIEKPLKKPKEPPIEILASRKFILGSTETEISSNYFEMDLFDYIQTVEPEEEDEEEKQSGKGKSDIHELNSSGIQYREEEYGIFLGKPKGKEKGVVMELDNELIEDRRPSGRPGPFPVESVGFPLNERLNHQQMENELDRAEIFNAQFNDEEFEKHFYQNHAEEDNNENIGAEKKEMRTREALNFLAEDNFPSQTADDEDNAQFRGGHIDFDKINVEEEFFLNKVEINEIEEESKDNEEHQDNEYYKSELYADKNNVIAKDHANVQSQNDFSYDEITPQKNQTAQKMNLSNYERVSYKPDSASLRKKMNWWSANKE